MGFNSPTPCQVFYPSKNEFSEPFCEFVRRIFRENEDIAMFKVVPPSEYKPRVTPFPPLDSIVITCPIRQHVFFFCVVHSNDFALFQAFGKQGAYRCYLVEHKVNSIQGLCKSVTFRPCRHLNFMTWP